MVAIIRRQSITNEWSGVAKNQTQVYGVQIAATEYAAIPVVGLVSCFILNVLHYQQIVSFPNLLL